MENFKVFLLGWVDIGPRSTREEERESETERAKNYKIFIKIIIEDYRLINDLSYFGKYTIF